jgi:hypothetical protein
MVKGLENTTPPAVAKTVDACLSINGANKLTRLEHVHAHDHAMTAQHVGVNTLCAWAGFTASIERRR